ncbi:MAG TPA: hypothetical protein DEG71_09310 [Clostridiales bacterium]|nr:hypothetical protein [Clostridiales bacterium]
MTPITILKKRKNGICTKIIKGKEYSEMLYIFGCIDNGVKKVVEVLAFNANEARQKIQNGKYHLLKTL